MESLIDICYMFLYPTRSNDYAEFWSDYITIASIASCLFNIVLHNYSTIQKHL